MRPGQQNKRGRGRNNNNSNNNNNNNNGHRKGGNPLTRTYDSSGPDVKIRGTAQHIAEKYAALARDAQSSGDRVIAENYLQHAEHYNRIIAAAQAQMQDRFQRDERSEFNDRNDFNDRDGFERDGDDMDAPVQEQPQVVAVAEPVIDGTGPQPVIEGTPAEVSLEEETPGAAGAARAPSRRRSAPRARRPRRGEGKQGEEGQDAAPAEGGDAPVLEAASE
ncbi:DUF4167 domain-containing protein [Sinorhizobium sp. BG8]|uniref:DUF4167 domain-containing protein n=1 Tax=Sinorhizobium sp. BG8 TaxID=2613773 RepID=UPI00193E1082|nr:DUF4167 domain-containing protein [Sinorhizobium sp. BG8]QRM53313.1 DUF4167 domain-containing protein [Sinorhizobium sp. BG8]